MNQTLEDLIDILKNHIHCALAVQSGQCVFLTSLSDQVHSSTETTHRGWFRQLQYKVYK